jgi:hypothetical protein
VEEFVAISSSLLVNMGTLSSDWVASKKLAAKQVSACGAKHAPGPASQAQQQPIPTLAALASAHGWLQIHNTVDRYMHPQDAQSPWHAVGAKPSCLGGRHLLATLSYPSLLVRMHLLLAPCVVLQAVALNKPWVLDPVGCGATTYRTAACVAMLQLQPTVVRGNASEILALAGAAGGRGVG